MKKLKHKVIKLLACGCRESKVLSRDSIHQPLVNNHRLRGRCSQGNCEGVKPVCPGGAVHLGREESQPCRRIEPGSAPGPTGYLGDL